MIILKTHFSINELIFQQTFYLFYIFLQFSKMRLVILATDKCVGEWSAKYVMKRINDFQAGPDK